MKVSCIFLQHKLLRRCSIYYRFLCSFFICLLIFGDCMKRLSHFVQPYGLSPVWVMIWNFNAVGQENLFSQKGHTNGFSPEWILIWTTSWLFLMNFLSQLLQAWGLSFVWIFVCVFRSPRDAHVFPQCKQLTAYNFKCTSFLCLCISGLNLKVLLHESHWNGVALRCL